MIEPLTTDQARSLMTLLITAVVIMGSPGPTNLSAAATGAAFGIRRAMPYVAGLALGTMAVLAAAAAGFVSLVSAIPMAPLLIRILGIAYILYLAWQIASAPPLEAGVDDAAVPTFRGGVLLGIANPKAYFAISAVVASATLIPRDPAVDAILKTVALSIIIIAIQAAWLLLGLLLARLMTNPAWSRPINIGMALLLIASAVLSVLS